MFLKLGQRQARLTDSGEAEVEISRVSRGSIEASSYIPNCLTLTSNVFVLTNTTSPDSLNLGTSTIRHSFPAPSPSDDLTKRVANAGWFPTK